MENKEIQIKSLKANFRDSYDLAAPVIKSLIEALNKQDSYSPLLVEKLNTNGFEIISPSRQGKFWYEVPSKSPLASSIIGIGAIASVALYPVYAIPVIGLGIASFSYSYYYISYFNSKIEKGYRTLQSSKEDIEVLLKSLIQLKKQLKDFPDELMPVDLKAKNIRKLVPDLVSLIGHSIYLNIERSNPIKISDVVAVMSKCKDLYSSGSHPELYFYEIASKSETIKKKSDIEERPEPILDLGEKPEHSVKDDAISEGIKMAKKLAEESSRPPERKMKKTPGVKKRKQDQNNSKQESSVVVPIGTNSKIENKEDLDISLAESKEQAAEVKNTEGLEKEDPSNNSHEEKSKISSSDQKDGNKTEGGLESPGDSMRTNEPVTGVFDDDDKEFLKALEEKDDQDTLDLMDDDDEELPEAQISEDDFDNLDDAYDHILEEIRKGD